MYALVLAKPGKTGLSFSRIINRVLRNRHPQLRRLRDRLRSVVTCRVSDCLRPLRDAGKCTGPCAIGLETHERIESYATIMAGPAIGVEIDQWWTDGAHRPLSTSASNLCSRKPAQARFLVRPDGTDVHGGPRRTTRAQAGTANGPGGRLVIDDVEEPSPN